MENKPSLGIRKSDLYFHCFTCNISGTFIDLLSHLVGNDSGREILINYFVNLSVGEKRKFVLELKRNSETPINNFVTEDELATYRYIHPYMYQRGLTDELIERFDVGYDNSTDELTFPVKDIRGNVVFIARRAVKTKRFHYPSTVVKPVYGANDVMGNSYRRVMICESVLNALTGWKYDVPAVALLGTGTALQYDILKKLPVRHYIIATDPDEAGDKAASKLVKALKGYKILSRLVIPKGEDINSLDKNFLNLDEYFC